MSIGQRTRETWFVVFLGISDIYLKNKPSFPFQIYKFMIVKHKIIFEVFSVPINPVLQYSNW